MKNFSTTKKLPTSGGLISPRKTLAMGGSYKGYGSAKKPKYKSNPKSYGY